MFVDDRERNVRFLLVEHGGFLGIDERKSCIPSTRQPDTSGDVHINDTRDHVGEAMTPDLANDCSYQSSIYVYYGCAPYWSAS